MFQQKFASEPGVGFGFLDGIQVFALEVFDERHFQHIAVTGGADDDGDFRQPEADAGAPPALAGNQLKAAVYFADDQRLNDAVLADGLDQFGQRFFAQVFARLQRTWEERVERDSAHHLARSGGGNDRGHLLAADRCVNEISKTSAEGRFFLHMEGGKM